MQLDIKLPSSSSTGSISTAPTTPAAPAAQPGRFVTRGGYNVCTVCGLVEQYCRGHAGAAPAGVPAADGEQSRLGAVAQRRGGR